MRNKESRTASIRYEVTRMESLHPHIMEECCCPKDEGGLGIRRPRDSNTTGMICLLWEVETNKTALWVKWVRRKYLRRGSIWCAQPPQSTSWTKRSVLQVCHLAKTFLNYSLGNGDNTLFFLDPWLNHQPLIVRLGDRLRQDHACDTACKASHLSATAIGTSPQSLPLRCTTSSRTSFVLPSMGIGMT